MADAPPWAGWFEEHPDGAIGFEFEDGTLSPPLRSYGAIRDYMHGLVDEEPRRKVVQVWRARHSGDDPDEVIDKILADPKLYPPDDQGGED
jgi:hypothetical protein